MWNSSFSWYTLSVICRQIEMGKVPLKNSINFTSLIPKLFCINWTAHIIQRKIVKLDLCTNHNKNPKKNIVTPTKTLLWQVIDIIDTSLPYTHEFSVALSFIVISSFPVCLLEAYFLEAYFTAKWLHSQLLVTYPDRGHQAKHFW